MVVFNLIQNTAFFTNGPQMNLTPEVRARLAQEGLATVNDLSDFKEEQLEQAYKNMRTSIPGSPAIPAQLDGQGNILVAAVPAIPPILPVLVSARAKRRLLIASAAFHYYESIRRDVTPQNMNYTLVLKDFYTEYEAVLELAKEDKPEVPVLHKNSTPLKWIESFKDCLFRTYGIRKTPLLYVVREDDEVPDEGDDPLTAGKAYGESGSVLDELIKRLDHDDPLFKSDNAAVYGMLEKATRGTVYASTIKPFSRTKDGRSAWLAMVSSHAGTDKWEQLFKERSKFLMNIKWNGQAKIVALEAEIKEVKQEPTLDEISACIAEATASRSTPATPTSCSNSCSTPTGSMTPQVAAAIKLRNILKRKRESSAQE